MNLQRLGLTPDLIRLAAEKGWADLKTGRVGSIHRNRFTVFTETGILHCQVTGNLLYSAGSAEELPVTGDWVVVQDYSDSEGIIHGLLPRRNALRRRAAGDDGTEQIVASNIDLVFILQSLDRDFSLNRLARFVTIAGDANINAILVPTKLDLLTEDETLKSITEIKSRFQGRPVVGLSNQTGEGIKELRSYIKPGQTVCLLGSSGVGKSSLVNLLCGYQRQGTAGTSAANDRGRHTTTTRDLIVLESGGVLIDNPGIREVGLTGSGAGLSKTFSEISQLASQCQFDNCSHTHEENCAVINAVANKALDARVYEQYLQLQKEEAHFKQSNMERRRKDRGFGKMAREVKKLKKQRRGQA